MQATHDFEVIIVGGGLVGAACALALKDSGMRLALVETKLPPALPTDTSWESRIYAISPGSVVFLNQLGVWQTLDQQRIAPIHDMHIYGDDGVSQLDFSAYEAGLPELACIAESRLMHDAIWRALQQQQNLQLFCPAQCDEINWMPEQVELRLHGGEVLRAKLVIGADGADSWVRSQARITAKIHSYQQSGVVANFETELAHGNIARQWFRSDGALAWLPLPGKRISIVWSAQQDKADELMHLPPHAFTDGVAKAGFETLGALHLITPPAAFPLRMVGVDTLVQPRLALIGDAAHAIHPLAGQGVNLGLQDAQQLARLLAAGTPDCGELGLLRRYERARKEDILALKAVTHGLHMLFNNTNPLLARLRNFGFTLTNRQSWIKNKLVQQALG